MAKDKRKWIGYVPTPDARMLRPIVYAHTKGEARALIKTEAGIPAKGRLPVGSLVTELQKTQPAF